MWFIVNTDKFQEQATKDFLSTAYPGIVKQVYLPKCRTLSVDSKGEEHVRFRPLIYGMVFVRADNEKALMKIISNWGYFVYEDDVRDLSTGKQKKKRLVATAHLLCRNVKECSQATIIKSATIPDDDMERFIYYNDKIADGIEGLSIVDKRYSDLILVNDTIRILSGPLKGWTGVVKQVKSNGRKDRHLFVRFGNDRCLNISNIRQYDMRIEHEAIKGEKSEAVGAWRAIDQMIGYLQAKEPSENASKTLRRLFVKYHKNLTVYRNRHSSDIAYSKKTSNVRDAHHQKVLDNIDDSMRSNFRILANYFKAGKSTLKHGLNELIPDAVLRPFLTPTSGLAIPTCQNYAVLRHNGITELIIRCNLRNFFISKENETEKNAMVFDEDYEYYAHFALLKTDRGKVKTICSWGGFYDYYAAQSANERKMFLDTLETKKYPRLHSLLSRMGDEHVTESCNDVYSSIAFEKIGGIGGFSILTDFDYTEDDAEAMAKAVFETFNAENSTFNILVAAAVEVWQGARLLVWRQLLQRYVLLHKVPVVDQPSVISHDYKTEEVFTKEDG